MIIETERLILREYTIEDFDALYEILSDPETMQHYPAEEKLVLSGETEIRYALAVCYLALIEEVEKYVRYEPDEPNYIRNTNDAGEMYDMAFSVL